MKKFFLLSVIVVLALSLTANAASLVVNLVAQSGDGYSVNSDGSNVILNGTATQLKIGVYATLTGNTSADTYLQTLYCNFKATTQEYGITGSFNLGTKTSSRGIIGDYASPYDASIAAPSVTSSLIGNLTGTSGDWIARSLTAKVVTNTDVLLGYIYYDVSAALGGSTEISYVKAIKNISTATFKMDGKFYNGSTGKV